MWVIFTEDGIPGWFGPEQVSGAEYVEDVSHDTLLSHRRNEAGEWVLRDPVVPEPKSDEQLRLEAVAAYDAAIEARETAIDAAVLASSAYRQFLRGQMTLTAYRDAASGIADSFPMPVHPDDA